jgi:hypothetical protein
MIRKRGRRKTTSGKKEKTVSECPKVTHPIRRKENGKNIKEDQRKQS